MKPRNTGRFAGRFALGALPAPIRAGIMAMVKAIVE
jgi:hypothetical protein